MLWTSLFRCRSASYYPHSGDCILSEEDRYTQPGFYDTMGTKNLGEMVEYLENNCSIGTGTAGSRARASALNRIGRQPPPPTPTADFTPCYTPQMGMVLGGLLDQPLNSVTLNQCLSACYNVSEIDIKCLPPIIPLFSHNLSTAFNVSRQCILKINNFVRSITKQKIPNRICSDPIRRPTITRSSPGALPAEGRRRRRPASVDR
jgi:hypothetical protein